MCTDTHTLLSANTSTATNKHGKNPHRERVKDREKRRWKKGRLLPIHMHNKYCRRYVFLCKRDVWLFVLLPAIQLSVMYCLLCRYRLMMHQTVFVHRNFTACLFLFWSVFISICLAKIVYMHLPLICNRTTI